MVSEIKKEDVREVMERHVGRGEAIFSGDVASRVGIEDEATHQRVREVLRELLKEGMPLASNPGLGYWVIENQEELDTYVGSLERRARNIETRKNDVLDAADAWENLDLVDDYDEEDFR